MASHPACKITIYDISGLLGRPYPLAMTPRNITKSFEITGIYPLNADIFTDDEFLSSYVTDRPEESHDDSALDQQDHLAEALIDADVRHVTENLQQYDRREKETSPSITICDIKSKQNPIAVVSRSITSNCSALAPHHGPEKSSTTEDVVIDMLLHNTTDRELSPGIASELSLAEDNSIAVVTKSTSSDYPTNTTPTKQDQLKESLVTVNIQEHHSSSELIFAKTTKEDSLTVGARFTTFSCASLAHQSFEAVDKWLSATRPLRVQANVSAIDTPEFTNLRITPTRVDHTIQKSPTNITMQFTSHPSDISLFTPAANSGLDEHHALENVPTATAKVNSDSPFRANLSTRANTSNMGIETNSTYVSPVMIRPHPKAGPKKKNKGRKKGATKILTDTPEKDSIEKEHREREEKKRSKLAATVKRNIAKQNKKYIPKAKKQRKNVVETSSDEENIALPPSPDSDTYALDDDEDEKSESEENDDGDCENVHKGDWVVVNLTSKKKLIHRYVGQVIKEHLASLDVKFAKKKIDDKKIKWPEKLDVRDGHRLEKPEHCRRELYNIMYYCWEAEPTSRPDFKEVVGMLERLLCTEMDYIELERFPDHSYYNVQHLDGEKL
ncbi:unnamed protein product [Euphydryas editha]|uniref:Serine-threonine/tyrosine-protein kinase catalytic domain-containing protein n=1 Tax=Euphydryas editha TaxID=104508 RepID=A0AAU9V3G2_EUPED|nr:unnamed protein product [Euphydryas editha]